MKQVKLKKRLENAMEAFFDGDRIEANAENNHRNSANLNRIELVSLTRKQSGLIDILRQVFLFLPSAFVLFSLTVGLTTLAILRPRIGEDDQLFIAIFVILPCSALMTILGLGEIRNIRHSIIPLSIIGFGMISGFIIGLLDLPSPGYFLPDYLPYFMPLALIIPVLAKAWVDKEEVISQ